MVAEIGVVVRQLPVAHRKQIGRLEMGQNLQPPNKFRHFYSLGARSMVLSTDDPARELLFEPWSHSGFMLAPILVGYPDIYLRGYGGV